MTSEWVTASIERGYCQDFQKFRVDKTGGSSTPTKQGRGGAPNLAEVSLCSTILNPEDSINIRSVEDTVNSTALEAGLVSMQGEAAITGRGKTTKQWLDELELGRVKKAGSFLDGCKLYLSGFTEGEVVHLGRVIRYAGGVHLSQLVESVSHVVHSSSSSMAPDTARLLTQLDLSPHNLSLGWLVESLTLGRPAPTSSHIFPPLAGGEGDADGAAW